jgi:hypothetical protein
MAASFEFTIFVPKDLGLKNVQRAVQNALKNTAKNVQTDFKVVTQTWDHKPAFPIKDISNASQLGQEVSTTDEVFGYVEEGTRPHIITPKRGRVLFIPGVNSRPKTRPRVIGSNKGGRDSTFVYTRRVQHPGTEAREFSPTIAKKWQAELPDIVQRAIDAEVPH